ncbi:MAG TPA: PQQ-dependent sugar dehydrogenase [Planctomycetota bacterium]|nr:PQQ-dependent sugar dehydrogenase [Planctomycetota bacterium]
MRRLLSVAIVLALGLPLYAQTAPTGFTVDAYGGPLYGGTAIAWSPDGRLFVARQFGEVRVIKNGSQLATPFHMAQNVDNPVGGERGLLGICVDPGFSSNGYVYIFYTKAGTTASHNVVRRLKANPPTSDVSDGTETAIVDLEDLGSSTEHNGGAIAFGGDGKLYVGVGENTDAAKAQSITSRFGKILRYNADGSIPGDNPSSFAGITGTTAGDFRAIWAVGLRNPFRFAFQPGSMHLHINDVGDFSWEEINEGAAGLNYGWVAGNTDGVRSVPGMTDPIYAYSHTGGPPQGTCITGGAFYNPSTVNFPGTYLGKYFFTDFGSGFIRYHDSAVPGTSFPFLEGASGPVDLSVGPDGALYYLALAGAQGVYRISYSSAAVQGLVVSVDALTVNEGSTATFSVRLSANPGGPVTVGVANTLGSASVSVDPSSLSFDGTNWNVNQVVTVSAGVDADVFDNGATLTIVSPTLEAKHVIVTDVDTSPAPVAGQPIARITLPYNGDVVSGDRAEFFGTATSSVATVRAEFYIDGTLAYTDVGPGHYHLNGGHTAWNTTLLSDGPHVLRMTVVDSAMPARTGTHEITVTVNNTAVVASTSAGSGSGGGGGGGCGLIGLETLLLLFLGDRASKR